MHSHSPASADRSNTSTWLRWFLIALAFLLLPSITTIASHKQPAPRAVSGPRVTTELHGTIATRDGQRLHLSTDLGNVVIHTQNTGKVDYHVHLEADASQKNADQLLKSYAVTAHETPEGVYFRGQTFGHQLRGRLWVTVEINAPKNYSLDVWTGGGNVETDDVNGRVTLSTAGGNIAAGNLGAPARLSTNGGHITVKNVSGELYASTGGGHITTGSIGGNATLHTVGGHIRVAAVHGQARFDTGGGNITLEHSGGELVAETAGGQIEVGEAAGLVRAKTGGGGIRVVRVSGPTHLETGGGSIYLTEVDGAVRASTGTGGITAWFVSPPKQTGACDLQSGDGDIIVYLPRQLPVTIDAQIQHGNEHRVFADPAFPLRVSYDDASDGSRRVRAEGALNGGGEVLRLRTTAGNIHLMLSDANQQIRIYKQQMEQLQQQLALQLRMVEQSLPGSDDRP
jgi:putative adhesin